MSQQKRKRGRAKKQPTNSATTILKIFLVLAKDIEEDPAQEVGRRLKKWIFPADKDKYAYMVAEYAEKTRIKWILSRKPDIIIVVARLQDIVGLTHFYEQLEKIKTRNPGYNPNMQVWEVESPPGKVPPLHPELSVNFLAANSVLIDILLTRSQRNYLN